MNDRAENGRTPLAPREGNRHAERDEYRDAGGQDSFWTGRKIKAGVAVLVVAAVGLLMATSRGCRPPSRIATGSRQDPQKDDKRRNQTFDAAWDALQQPEAFDGMFTTDDLVSEDLDRLNQWLKGLEAQKPPADWKVDPLAAPLAKPLGSFVEYVQPVDAALAGPRDALELKAIARHFVAPAARLEVLAQTRSLAELDAMARQYEESLKQIGDIARKASDALREERELSRDPTSVGAQAGGGSGDPEVQLSLFESRFIDQFSRRVGSNAANQATFKQLYAIARQLDYPGRMRDPASLAALAQALAELAAKHERKEVEDLVRLYEEVVIRYGGSFNKTRLSAELRFVLDEMGNSERMKDLAEWKALEQTVAEMSERLKIAGKRTGRAELSELALRVEESRNKRDIAALQTEAAELAKLVRPDMTDDLKDSARQLADRAKLLVQLAELVGRLGQERRSEGLQSLAKYVAALAADVKSAAERLENPTGNTGNTGKMPVPLQTGKTRVPPTGAQQAGTDLDRFTAQYALLGVRVGRLAEDLGYFATLGALHFPAADIGSLREAILLRDVSRWARGEESGDLSRAKHLFDWTVRNIQLAPDGADPFVGDLMKRPWETLILGTGTAMERATVFILLARQQGLDAVVLALEDGGEKPAPEGAGEKPAPQSRLRPWVVAVLSEKDLYLFDPYLGLPVAGPGAITLGESGQLDVRPATLAQVLDDQRLLRQMDLDAARPYWVQGPHLKKVVALVEGSPPYLAERMRLVESRLSADDRVVLAAAEQHAPSSQAERIKTCRGIAEVQLWPLPYEIWFQRIQIGDEPIRRLGSALGHVASGALWKGRVRHLEHKFTGESSAALFYDRARPLDREIEAFGPAERTEGRTAKAGSQREVELAATLGANLRNIARMSKQDAGYWLGLMFYEQGQSNPRGYVTAVEYLGPGIIEAYPGGPWTPGAKYNLGRAYEAQKSYPQAIQAYCGNTESAQSYGDQLRARWLEKLTVAELPGLPGLPVEKPSPKKEVPSKKEPPAKEKSGILDLPKLPGL